MGPEQMEALKILKEDLAKALAYLQVGYPFIIHFGTTEAAMGATLLHSQERKMKIIANTSKTLSSHEQTFTPCKKECLALDWVLRHWEYVTGSSQIVIQTIHSPLKDIISRKLHDGQVSSPRLLTQWTLPLMSRGVEVQKEERLAPTPSGLLGDGEEHDCPLPEHQHIDWPVKGGK